MSILKVFNNIRKSNVGFKNIENSCYMNSALQCLINVVPFSCYSLSLYLKKVKGKNDLDNKIKFFDLYGQLLCRVFDSANNEEFTRLLRKIRKKIMLKKKGKKKKESEQNSKENSEQNSEEDSEQNSEQNTKEYLDKYRSKHPELFQQQDSGEFLIGVFNKLVC